MVAEDRYCNDILIQLSAIESSIKSLSMHILENQITRHIISVKAKEIGRMKDIQIFRCQKIEQKLYF